MFISKMVAQFENSGSIIITASDATVEQTIQDAVKILEEKGALKFSYSTSTNTLSNARWVTPARRVSYSMMQYDIVRRIKTAAENAGLQITLGCRLIGPGGQLNSTDGMLDAIFLKVVARPQMTSFAQSQG